MDKRLFSISFEKNAGEPGEHLFSHSRLETTSPSPQVTLHSDSVFQADLKICLPHRPKSSTKILPITTWLSIAHFSFTTADFFLAFNSTNFISLHRTTTTACRAIRPIRPNASFWSFFKNLSSLCIF